MNVLNVQLGSQALVSLLLKIHDFAVQNFEMWCAVVFDRLQLCPSISLLAELSMYSVTASVTIASYHMIMNYPLQI